MLKLFLKHLISSIQINKGYVSGMTPADGGNLVKANTVSPVNISGNTSEQPSAKTDSKMTVGQQKSSNEARTDRRSSSRNSNKIAKSSTTGNAAVSTGHDCPVLPQRDGDAPDERVRSVGTLTTHSDIGISAEPESLGPCEPGTNVNLSGIVWHETESGELYVYYTSCFSVHSFLFAVCRKNTPSMLIPFWLKRIWSS